MSGRHPLLRMLVMVGAAVQLLSPAVASIADGLLAQDSASSPLTHIEATSSSTCPVVHPPDCGVCRYLSAAGTQPRVPATMLVVETRTAPACLGSPSTGRAGTSLPDGRAPPVL